jgi:peptidoglycan/xylan/chitin deacetylase (PgdA/CDA1 family)
LRANRSGEAGQLRPVDGARERGRPEVLVLCYHAVSARWPERIAVTPDALHGHIEKLLGAGFRGMTFTEAVSRPPHGRTLVVTFDDAYRSVIEQAHPILSGLGVPATVFVPTGHVGNRVPRSWPGVDRWLKGSFEDELIGASWDELASLASDGWEIGSHTRSHPRLPELDDSALTEELKGSRVDCEDRLGVPCRSIAYPYGDDDDRVAEVARRAGYSAGATVSGFLEPAGISPDPLRWPRLGVTRGDGVPRLRAKITLYRHPRAWNAMRRSLRGLRRLTPQGAPRSG